MNEVIEKIFERISKYGIAQQIWYWVFRDNIKDILEDELSPYTLVPTEKLEKKLERLKYNIFPKNKELIRFIQSLLPKE